MKPRPTLRNIHPYTPGKPIEEVQRELNLNKVIKLASNENPLGPSPQAIEIIQNEAAKIWLYPEGSAPDLKVALAKYYQVGQENIILGNGSDEILQMIALAYVNPGDQVLTAKETFSEYEFVTRIADGKIIQLPLHKYRFDVDSFIANYNANVKVIFIANPNNPTGTIITSGELVKLLNAVSEDTLVVLDEAYYEYVQNPEYPQTLSLLSKHPNLIILRTFSKIYGLAGLRIGYGFAHPEIIKALNTVRQPFNVSTLAQKAAIASLADQAQVTRSRKLVWEMKKFFYQQLDALKLEYVPTEANFVCINLNRDAQPVFEQLLRSGIIIRPLASFGLPEAIRVTIGKVEENEAFFSALCSVNI